MSESAPKVVVDLRIPGTWASPQEFMTRVSKECSLTNDTLTLPDGTEVEIGALPADRQFASIFRSSCRQPATKEELATVDSYKVNITLSGPGGSLDAARAMMRAALAVMDAGGAGVFIDNSGLAHGSELWRQMLEDGGPDALSFAFVSIIRGDREVWTVGLHVLGRRDIVMKREDIEVGGYDITEVIRYVARGAKPIEEGHILADAEGPRFRVTTEPSDSKLAAHAMHNPYGRMRLVSMKDIAEAN